MEEGRRSEELTRSQRHVGIAGEVGVVAFVFLFPVAVGDRLDPHGQHCAGGHGLTLVLLDRVVQVAVIGHDQAGQGLQSVLAGQHGLVVAQTVLVDVVQDVDILDAGDRQGERMRGTDQIDCGHRLTIGIEGGQEPHGVDRVPLLYDVPLLVRQTVLVHHLAVEDGLARVVRGHVDGGLTKRVGGIDILVLFTYAGPAGSVTLELANALDPPVDGVAGDDVAVGVFEGEGELLDLTDVVDGVRGLDGSSGVATDDVRDPGLESIRGGAGLGLVVPVIGVPAPLGLERLVVEELLRIRVAGVVGNGLYIGLAGHVGRDGDAAVAVGIGGADRGLGGRDGGAVDGRDVTDRVNLREVVDVLVRSEVIRAVGGRHSDIHDLRHGHCRNLDEDINGAGFLIERRALGTELD